MDNSDEDDLMPSVATQEDYLVRSKDTLILSDNLVDNEHGFASYSVFGDVFTIFNVYGDGEYWDTFLCEKAKSMGFTKVQFATLRNPEAFERKYNYKTVGYIMEKGI